MSRTRVGIVAFAAFVLSSCSDDILFEPNLADKAIDSSTTQLAVLSVHPWEEIAPLMKPNFELGPTEALDRVLPTTSAFTQKILDVFAASAGVAISSKTGREQVNSEAKPEDKQLSRTAPPVLFKVNEDGSLSTATLPDGFKITNADSEKINTKIPGEKDPIIQYQLANALMQEVAQLNSMVERIATREGYEPYLVRMQLTNMPLVRHQPYDVYANLSFINDYYSGQHEAKKNKEQPLVIPLLVTDNIEGSLQSRTARVIRQFSLALDFAFKGIAGDLDTVRLRDKLDSILGVEQNSLYTIGRTSENSIQVRLGAPFNPTARYAMVPRTHNISLVVMVHRGHLSSGRSAKKKHGPQVKVYMTTQLRNATDRKNVLKHSSRRDQLAMYAPLKRYFERDDRKKRSNKSLYDLMDQIFAAVSENNYKKFEAIASEGNPSGWYINTEDTARFIWAEMSKIIAHSRFAFAAFELPEPIRPKIANSLIKNVNRHGTNWAQDECIDAWAGMAATAHLENQDLAGDDYGQTHAVLFDSTGGTHVQLGNVSGISHDRLNAVLVARNQDGQRLEIPANKVSVQKLGTSNATPDVLNLHFPHLTSLNIRDVNPQGSYLKMTYAPPKWRSRNRPYRYAVCALKYASANTPGSGVPAPLIGSLPGTNIEIDGANAVITFTDVDDLNKERLDVSLVLGNEFRIKPVAAVEYDSYTRKLVLKFKADTIKKFVSATASDPKSIQSFDLEIVVNPTYSEALRGHKRRKLQVGAIKYLPSG